MAQVNPDDSTAAPAPFTVSPEMLSARLAEQAKKRERTLKRLRKLRTKAADEIDRLLEFLDASDPYVTTELEEQVDDDPCDDNELDGPENGEDEESDPPEPSLGSVGAVHIDQTGWAGGNSRDLEQDDSDSGIADQDGLDEQVPFRDWQMVGMV